MECDEIVKESAANDCLFWSLRVSIAQIPQKHNDQTNVSYTESKLKTRRFG